MTMVRLAAASHERNSIPLPTSSLLKGRPSNSAAMIARVPPTRSGLLQRKRAYGGSPGPSGECEECRKKRLSLQRKTQRAGADSQHSTFNTQQGSDVPPIVQDVLRSPGQPLDSTTRAFMEPRFGHDFSKVRVHTDAKAAESARAVNALAYTVGRDVAFGAGRYAPGTLGGNRLLAHELVHVVQQDQGGGGHGAESRADALAQRIVDGESVTSSMIGGAARGLYAQTDQEQEPRRMQMTEPVLSLDWEFLAQFGLFPSMPPLAQPGTFQLTPPSLRAPSPAPPSLGLPSLTPPSTTPPGLIPPTPTRPSSATTPEAPSRLPIITSGQFSLGLRLGFPEAEVREIPGAPEPALKGSLRRAEIISQTLSGKIPTGWEAIDKSKLASAVWGIFSTNIAPDLARRISSGLSTPIGPGRTSYELDLLILGDFSGGGISFTVRH
jgi:hypothetical protein